MVNIGNRDAQLIFYKFYVHTADHKCVIAYDLGRGELKDLIHNFVEFIHGCGTKISRGHIHHRQSETVVAAENTHEIIVFLVFQTLLGNICSRSHDPDDLSLYDPFRLFRVLHLLTDRNFISLLHQFIEIGIHRMERDSAHGGPFFHAAVFSGQCDLQFPGSRQCIVKEHLIKISQPVKQNAVLILFFDRHILFHHWS